MSEQGDPKGYWKSSIKIVLLILSIWFTVSFLCGIVFRDELDKAFSIGNARFGFWMAQQGSIICFVLLLVLYAFFMNRLDHKHGYDQVEEEAAPSEPQSEAQTEEAEK